MLRYTKEDGEQFCREMLCDTHPKAFKSQTGALLDLNIRSFQILCVVNYCLKKST